MNLNDELGGADSIIREREVLLEAED
jgi:V-type H+-transporting ATPase subunit a